MEGVTLGGGELEMVGVTDAVGVVEDPGLVVTLGVGLIVGVIVIEGLALMVIDAVGDGLLVIEGVIVADGVLVVDGVAVSVVVGEGLGSGVTDPLADGAGTVKFEGGCTEAGATAVGSMACRSRKSSSTSRIGVEYTTTQSAAMDTRREIILGWESGERIVPALAVGDPKSAYCPLNRTPM